MLNPAAFDAIRDEIQNLRTLIITSVAGSFAVLFAAVSTDKMVDLIAAKKFWSIPQGVFVLGPWILAIVFLSFALRRLSPADQSSPTRRFELLWYDYQSLSQDQSISDEARKAFEKKLKDKLGELSTSIGRAYDDVSISLCLFTLSVVIVFLIALQII